MDSKQTTRPRRRTQPEREHTAAAARPRPSGHTGAAASGQNRSRPAGQRTAAGSLTASRKPDAQTQARARQARRRAKARRTTERQAARPTPDVVYTPPKPFSRSRILLQLASVVAVVLALTFGMSIFFKVETITVSGATKYSAWDVKDASGIQQGESLLGFGEIKASSNIIAELPYVKDVRIGIKLPDTVNIVIEELDVGYSIQDNLGLWWMITADGRVVERLDNATATEYTQVLGVTLQDPEEKGQAVAQEADQADPSDPSAETEATLAPITVTGAQRLEVAMSILHYLEEGSLMGLVASVNVADLDNIELWYGQQYQVRLGDTTQLAHKIDWMQKAISQLADYDSGLLDISFTLVEDQVIYDQFTDE